MGNWDFDGDEAIFFLASAAVMIFGACGWYLWLARPTRLGERGPQRLLLGVTPLVALLGLWFVLMTWADPKYVVGNLDYQLLFTAGGGAWLVVVAGLTKLLGVSVRDDAIERRNLAAAVMVSGGALGVMCIYAACNVGSGPTIWTTIFPAAVATVAWLVLWLIVELFTRTSEAITIERDLATGIRAAAFLLAAGLVLGRAMAGDWTSWESTFSEFRRLAWPAGLLAAIAIVAHIIFRPTAAQPRPAPVGSGMIPAAVLLALALGYVISLGPADIGKHVITYEEYTGHK